LAQERSLRHSARDLAMRWLALATYATAGVIDDVDAALRDIGEQDSSATTKVGCWCDSIRSVLAARTNDAETDLRSLETGIAGATAGNVALGIETRRHESEAAKHAQALDAASAIRDRNHERFKSEEQDAMSSLDGLNSAQEVLPPLGFLQQPSNSQIAGVLDGLEDTFKSSLEKARADEATQKSQFDDLYAAKSKLQKLEAASAARKKERMAATEMQLARDKQTQAALEGRQEADGALRAAVEAACEAVTEGAAARTEARQAAVVALSTARADAAKSALHQSFALVQHGDGNEAVDVLKRLEADLTSVPAEDVADALELAESGDVEGAAARVEALQQSTTGRLATLQQDAEACHSEADSEQHTAAEEAHTASADAAAELADTQKESQELQDLVAKAQGVEQALAQVLHAQTVQALNAKGRLGADAGGSAELQKLQDRAQADLDALPGAFSAVADAGKGSARADLKVNAARLEQKADASAMLVSVEKEGHSARKQRCADLEKRSDSMAKDERTLRAALATLHIGLR